MKYLPFLNGTYSVAPGLLPIAKQEFDWDQRIFQLDDQYEGYLDNKASCRQEDIHKYYLEENLSDSTGEAINAFILQQLLKEEPAQFDLSETGQKSVLLNLLTGEIIIWYTESQELISKNHLSLFDALCCQVQEDLAICQLEGNLDWLAAIHLCAPNHWAAGDKVGKPFDAIHAAVPGMEKTMPHYFKMLQSIVNKGPFTRFAWGISTDTRLNHHPKPAPGNSIADWQGRSIDSAADLFIRTERQNLIGFPTENAFLFTIRTYFYPVAELDGHEKAALWSAVRTMSRPHWPIKDLPTFRNT